MDRSVQMRRLALAVVGICLGGAASAAQMTSGLWQSQQRTLVNGKDAAVVLEQLNKQMRIGLPKGMGSQASVSMDANKTVGTTKVCVTPAVGATMTNSATIFSTFAKMNPSCQLTPSLVTPSKVVFNGRCSDATSFSGHVTGQLTVENASSWRTDVSGFGRFPGAMLTAMNLPSTAVVNVQTTSVNRWVSPTCPVQQ